MKISLFFKPYIIKACIFVFVILPLVALPSPANAGFFSNLITKVFGDETTNVEITAPKDDEVIHNSQNVPLLETSINPDLKSTEKSEPEKVAIKDETFLSNEGALGMDSELEKYASSAKITVYVVKKGDTIESISRDLKISKEAIIASNADLKKSDMIKIGQKLVIIGLKDDKNIVKKETKTEIIVSKKDETPILKEEPKKEETTQAPIVQTPVVNTPPVQAEQNQDQSTKPEKPEGTIEGGYIWPFPEGVGRVSQGRHADNAYDFAAPKGTPIYAVQSGTVLIAHPTGYNGGYGLYVVINFDDGRQAIFGHMSKVLVTEGQTVKQGETVGLVGSTGKSTGPHLHLGFHGPMSNPYLGLKKNSTGLENHD